MFGSRDWFWGKQFFHGPGVGVGGGLGMIQEQRWVAAVNTDEASLTPLPLTSCCVARLLSGHGPVQVHGPGVGDPCFKRRDRDPNTQKKTWRKQAWYRKKKTWIKDHKDGTCWDQGKKKIFFFFFNIALLFEKLEKASSKKEANLFINTPCTQFWGVLAFFPWGVRNCINVKDWQKFLDTPSQDRLRCLSPHFSISGF